MGPEQLITAMLGHAQPGVSCAVPSVYSACRKGAMCVSPATAGPQHDAPLQQEQL